MKQDHDEYFSFKSLPEDVNHYIFKNLSMVQLCRLQCTEKIKQDFQENEKFWQTMKLSVLKKNYPQYAKQIDTLISEGFAAKQIITSVTYFGSRFASRKAQLFMDICLGDMKVITHLQETDFPLLTNFITNLPQHSIVQYLLEKGQQDKLDFLHEQYTQMQIRVFRQYPTYGDDQDCLKSNLYLNASGIARLIGEEKYRRFQSMLTDVNDYVLSLFEICLEYKDQFTISKVCKSMEKYISFNQVSTLLSVLEFIENNFDKIQNVAELGRNFSLLILYCIRSNPLLLDQLMLFAEKFTKESKHYFFRSSNFFPLIIHSIVQGDPTRLQKLLDICLESGIDIEKTELPIYACFAKRNFQKIIEILDKNEVKFESTRTYKTSELLYDISDFCCSDRVKSLNSTTYSELPLLFFAILAENNFMINKIKTENIEALNVPFTFHPGTMLPIEYAISIDAISSAHYLLKCGADANTLSGEDHLTLLYYNHGLKSVNWA